MTQKISPLRQRVIDDMTIRNIVAFDSKSLRPRCQEPEPPLHEVAR
jgi:hypothetical protein